MIPNQDTPITPARATWDGDYIVGHELIDAQHLQLLQRCNHLADLLGTAPGEARDQAFDQGFDELKALARAHFDAESALLAEHSEAEAEDHRVECDEFEYLASDIVTTDNFDRLELQRFLVLWFTGHIVGSARQLRTALAGGSQAS
jgi:hemerythrin-like metal-binding protein